MRKILLLLFLAAAAKPGHAKLNILCTTADLGAVAREVAGVSAEVSVLCAPDRDPHFLEPKPSYMIKASRADLVFANGLELEIGWLPAVLRGGRNPRVLPGSSGYLEAQAFIQPLEIPAGPVSRAQGDVHPGGNPHFMVDPIRAGLVAVGLAERLAELDPSHAVDYRGRAGLLKTRLEAKTAAWRKRVQASGTTRAFTYHRTLVYFFDRFGLENAGNLEPKPGIPPNANHLLDLIHIATEAKVGLILVEHYFDLGAARIVASKVPGMRYALAPVMPGALGTEATLDSMLESLVRIVEGDRP